MAISETSRYLPYGLCKGCGGYAEYGTVPPAMDADFLIPISTNDIPIKPP